MAFPDLIRLEDYNGSYEEWIEAVFQTYYQDVVRARLTFNGLSVGYKYEPATDGKGFAFWHCVSEGGRGKSEDDRTIDIRRAERIGWIPYALSNAARDGDVLWWENLRGTSRRAVIWIPTHDYAVVLERRQNLYMLWTTYKVRSGRARQFRNEHRDYWATQ